MCEICNNNTAKQCPECKRCLCQKCAEWVDQKSNKGTRTICMKCHDEEMDYKYDERG